MKSIRIYIIVFFIALSTSMNAQLKIDAELRPRFEYRHGFKTLFPDNVDPAAFVSQRTRLKAGFTMEKLDFFISVQDVRVWGDVATLNTADNNGFSLHEAWANIWLSENFALKLGRQEINLDDQRIFGSVNWVQQARSHDAALLNYKKDKFKMSIAFAFNQEGESLANTTYNITNNYKAMQYVWLHKDWESFSGSFLFLNNGLQFIDTNNADNNDTRYSQTVGTHLQYKKGKLKLSSNLYYQFGKDRLDNSLSAYLLGLDAKYGISKKVTLGTGLEYISGNDNGAPANGDNNAFTPLYGTNHKFNGLMDYFYVGNHGDNVGLFDIYLNSTIAINPKSKLNISFHNFSAAADLSGSDEKQLGNELDLTYSYKLQKSVVLKAGYSHLFASDGMEILKGNTDGNTNNWGWVMIVINPTLFQTTK